MKAKREQVNDKLIVIKLFGRNYARDRIFIHTKVQTGKPHSKNKILHMRQILKKVLN